MGNDQPLERFQDRGLLLLMVSKWSYIAQMTRALWLFFFFFFSKFRCGSWWGGYVGRPGPGRAGDGGGVAADNFAFFFFPSLGDKTDEMNYMMERMLSGVRMSRGAGASCGIHISCVSSGQALLTVHIQGKRQSRMRNITAFGTI
ncbi:hypothetical protein LZ32DRAFT_300694 [Colletotrichum eremochloae]|nr:hypothetical protein LZ32DRAFT_300694 [Colletotrichum eremochloae]